MTKSLAAALLFCTISCASAGGRADAPPASATVTLLSIAPTAGAELTEQSVLVAELAYSIEGFRPAAEYYIAPLFAAVGEAGTTFNARDRIIESQPVTAPQGRITLRYNVAGELRSSKLARPIRVWFYVMERTGEHTSRIAGKSEAVHFAAPSRP